MNDLNVARNRLVVLGGTGFVGQHLANHLLGRSDLDVLFAVHRSEPAWLKEGAFAEAHFDVTDAATLSPILKSGCTVLNLLRPDGTGWFDCAIRSVLEACAYAKVSRYVHVSSIDVFGAAAEQVMSAGTVIKPITPYEKEHAAAEAMVVTRGCDFEVTIVRLGAVFGLGGLNVVSFIEEAATAPKWKLGLRRALYGRRRMHLVSVEKVVRALTFLAFARGISSGEIILVTDDDVPENNFAYLQDVLLSSFGRKAPRYMPHLPLPVLKSLLKLRGISSSDPMRRFQDGRLVELGMDSSVSFVQELQRYIEHVRDNR